MKSNFLYHKKRIFITLAISVLATCPGYVFAAPAAAVPPNSGAAIEGAKPPAAQDPRGQTPSILVEGQAPTLQEDDNQQKITVSGFRISGELPVAEKEILRIVQSEAGKEITLGRLNTLCGEVTQYLRQKGYLVAFAYIPPQDITGGIVEIAVVSGKYGEVKIIGDGHLRHARLKDMLFAAKPGMLITRSPLERALLLINDLNGVAVKGTLTPGATPGTADLILDVTDTGKVNGTFYTDNWGNRYTGCIRYGIQASINNISQNGDNVSLGGLTTRQGINNYNLGYSANLGNDGAKAEIKYSRVDYTLGDTFAGLGATGQAEVTNYSISYPLIRGRAFSLYSTIGYDSKGLRDDIANVDSYSPRTSTLWNLGLSGSFADTWLRGSTNTFTLTHYQGKLNFQNGIALENDNATAKTSGAFSKTVLAWQRQQYITKNLNFHLNFTGQLADKNLDSSEKIYLGGADGVRAFPQGEAAGDQGYRLTGELRWRIPGLSTTNDSLYLNSFYDYGSVMINKRHYGADTNRNSLMGAGLGLLWVRSSGLVIRLDYAWKIGQDISGTDNNNKGRLWLQGVKYF